MSSSKIEKFFTTKNTKGTKREGLEIFVSFVVRLSLAVFGVDGEGDGAVVYEGDFHVRAELAGLHCLAKFSFQRGDELFVQWDGDLRLGGASEGGSVAFFLCWREG